MIGLGNPLGLLALAAVAVLVALHLLTRRRHVVPVASLVVWRHVAAQPLERQRLRPDVLFWLRLAILLALAAALARPWIVRRGASEPAPLALVLDVSASMQTREDDGVRLELARARLAQRLEALAPGAPVMLIAAGDRPRVVTPWTTEHTGARRALAGVRALDTPTRLEPALALALGEAASRRRARVVVATDLERDTVGLAPSDLDRLDWMQVGRTSDNVAVAGLGVVRAPFGGVRDASAVVRSYAPDPRTVELTASIDGRPWAVHRLELPPRGTVPLRLGKPPGAGVLGVSLRGAGGGRGAHDALAVDDRAFAWLPPAEPAAVSVVGDEPPLARLLGAAIGRPVSVIAPSALESAPPAGVLIVSGALPPVLPQYRGLLLVDPPPGDALCAGGALADGAAVVDWSDGHPLLAGLGGLEALEVDGARALAVPAWGEAVVQAAAGTETFPLLVAGTRAGIRTACLGVGLDSLAASDRVPLVVLLLATLRWLGEGESSGIDLVTGRPETTALAVRPSSGAPSGAEVPRSAPSGDKVPRSAPSGDKVPRSAPSGDKVPRSASGPALVASGDPPVLLATKVGVHRLDGEQIAVANLFDDAESDVGRRGDGDWSPLADASTSASDAGRAVGWWCLLVALAVVVLEWLVWAWRGETA
jgi:hypothetical protein